MAAEAMQPDSTVKKLKPTKSSKTSKSSKSSKSDKVADLPQKNLVKSDKEKMLISNKTGLSLAPIRVKNMLVNLFNNRALVAESEFKAFSQELLEASNLKDGYISFHGFSAETRSYLKELLDSHLTLKRTQFERKALKEIIKEHDKANLPAELTDLLETRKAIMRENPQSDLSSLYKKYNKNFYKSFTEESDVFNLAGKDAFTFYKSLIARDKIRMNESSRVRLTCFIELTMRHFIRDSFIACVLNEKKNVNTTTMQRSTLSYLTKLVHNLSTWGALSRDVVGLSPEQLLEFTDLSTINPDNKFKFKTYIVDMCKSVHAELVANPPDITYPDSVKDVARVFGSLVISNEFKEFCTQSLVQLLYNLGVSVLTVMKTMKERCLDSDTVDSIIKVVHVVFNVDNLYKTTVSTLDKMGKKFTDSQKLLKIQKTQTHVEHSADQSTDQSSDQSLNQSSDQSLNQSSDQSPTQSSKQVAEKKHSTASKRASKKK